MRVALKRQQVIAALVGPNGDAEMRLTRIAGADLRKLLTDKAHLAAEITDRRKEMMRLLYMYEKIRVQHYGDPLSLPTRSKGAYLALIRGLGQGQQFLAWCDEALELLSSVDSAARQVESP